VKKLLLLIILFSSGFWFNTYAQKGSPSPKIGTNSPQSNSANCPLVVAIQDRAILISLIWNDWNPKTYSISKIKML
jgi:hypothetical protein